MVGITQVGTTIIMDTDIDMDTTIMVDTDITMDADTVRK